MKPDNSMTPSPLSSFEFQAEAIDIQDALIILAIRLMGEHLQHSAAIQDHVMDVARETPHFSMEARDKTRKRLNKYLNWKESMVMELLFVQALETLECNYRHDALKWVTEIALGRPPTKRLVTVVHQIATTLGFSAAEVSDSLDRVCQPRHVAAESKN
jgi:hypothetical protein